MSLRLLVLSNGAGEDAIAASILDHLGEVPVAVFPLVGAGSAYRQRWPVWGEREAPPSQGLSNASWRLWFRDLRQGLLARVGRQWAELKRRRREVAAVLAVGDLFPVVLAGLGGLAPIYFVGTAKSVYHHAYSALERWALRRYCRECMVRDEATAQHLRSFGLRAGYLGNPMMDATVPTGRELGLDSLPLLVLFPGSRAQAASELPRLLRVWSALVQQVPCQAAVALAPGVMREELVARCSDWQFHGDRLHRPGLPDVLLVEGALGDLLSRASLALGQAGTAHEQAAGAGVPVVSLHSGPLGWYRGRQKGLLGEALVLAETESEAVIRLARLLTDSEERNRLAAVGRQRMGEPGGARRIASWLLERI